MMSKLVYCIFFLISLLPFRVLYILSDIAYCVIYKLWGWLEITSYHRFLKKILMKLKILNINFTIGFATISSRPSSC